MLEELRGALVLHRPDSFRIMIGPRRTKIKSIGSLSPRILVERKLQLVRAVWEEKIARRQA